MWKEIIISGIIVIAIIIGNILSQNYTKECVSEITGNLNEIRKELKSQNKETEKISYHINEIHDKWDGMYEKLAYFIEHDELEKVETQLTAIRGNIEVEEYEQGVPELDKCIYILNHIENKEALMIQNIF